MSLRARLLVGFIGLLLLVIGALGVVLVRTSRSVLVSQLDHDLREVASRASEADEAINPPDGPSGDGDVDRLGLNRRAVAVLVLDASGSVVTATPSGFADAPDPLPDASSYTAPTGDIQTVPAVTGSLHYRAVGDRLPDGSLELYAIATTGVDAAVGALLRVLVLTGAAVLVLGGAATWVAVRTALQPVEEMVDTAAVIAGGDLSRRVPEVTGSAEIDRLGMALNDMLGQIEGAFSREQEIKDQLKRFVSDASHELRTPLFAVQGYTELYRSGALEGTDQLDNAMRRISTESERMQHLVEDLLLLARLDEHRPIESHPVDLAVLVRDAAADARAIDPGRPLTLEAPDSLVVPGDGRRLAQVVTNLLANTRTHTAPGTPVSVRLAVVGKSAVIDVVDDGPGLSPDQLEHVFDRFYRGDASRARKTGGAGLGLSIVAAVVESHGGTVEAANEPGKGARFSVRIPVWSATPVTPVG